MSDDWIIAGVTQFIQSPLWSQPVQDFIDDHCVVFGEAEANENGTIATSLFSGSDANEASTGSSGNTDLSPELIVIHKQFAELIDSVLTQYLEELGVDAAKALEVLQASNSPDAKNFIKYLLSLDDFRAFKSMMVKRNHELELEALRAIEKKIEKEKEDKLIAEKNAALNVPTAPSGNNGNDDGAANEEDEDLRQAIAMSLAEQEALKLKEAEMQDAELREALALSRAMEDERLGALKAEQQAILDAIEQSKKDAANAAAAAQAEELQKAEAERQARKAKAEEEYKLAQQKAAEIAKEAAAKRREIADRMSDIIIAREEKKQQQQKQATPTTESSSSALAPPPPPPQETTATATTSTAPAATTAAPSTPPVAPTPAPTTTKAPEEEPKPVASVPPTPAPTNTNTSTAPAPLAPLPAVGLAPVASLAPMGGSSHATAGSFSIFSKLPSKKGSEQPSGDDQQPLSSLIAESISKKQAEKKTSPSNDSSSVASPAVSAPATTSAEELERRAAYLRQQRDAIIAKRKAEREAEMNRYSGGRTTTEASAGAAASSAPENKNDTHTGSSGKATDSVHAQLTQELARRFKPQ